MSGKFQHYFYRAGPKGQAIRRLNPTTDVWEIPTVIELSCYPKDTWISLNPTTDVWEIPTALLRLEDTTDRLVSIPPLMSGKFQRKLARWISR